MLCFITEVDAALGLSVWGLNAPCGGASSRRGSLLELQRWFVLWQALQAGLCELWETNE